MSFAHEGCCILFYYVRCAWLGIGRCTPMYTHVEARGEFQVSSFAALRSYVFLKAGSFTESGAHHFSLTSLRASLQDVPVTTPTPPLPALGSQARTAATHGILWVLSIQTQVPMLSQQVLGPLSHPSSPTC